MAGNWGESNIIVNKDSKRIPHFLIGINLGAK